MANDLATGTDVGALASPAGRIALKSYACKDGLENLGINQVIQDSLGHLWVGTQGGLFRFDGLRFQGYGTQEGLPSSNIIALLATVDGLLWVATEHGGLVRCHSERSDPFQPVQGVPEAGLRGLALGGDGTLWAASASGLFVSRNREPFRPAQGWPGGPVLSLAATPDSELIWVHGGGALHAMTAQGLRRRYTAEEGFISAEASALVVDQTGRLWVRTPGTLQSLRPGADHLENHLELLPPCSEEQVDLALLRLGRPGTLLATSERGVHVVRSGSGQAGLEAELIGIRSVRCVFSDQEGSIWIGATGGLYRTLGHDRVRTFGRGEGLPHETIWAIHRAPDGTLWVGTEDGICRTGAAGWERIPGTQGMRPYCMATGPDGGVWVGGSHGLLFRVDPQTLRLVRVGPDQGLSAECILNLLWDRQGRLWVAARWSGLFRGEAPGGQWRFAPVPLPAGLAEEDVRGLAEDGEGRILVAGSRGLAVLDQGRWQAFNRQDGLRHDCLDSLVPLPNGGLCVTYTETLGISLLRLTEGRIRNVKHLDQDNGLCSNRVYLAGLDARMRLWIGTGNGVSVLEGGHLECYSTDDGLAGDDCDQNAFFPDPDGGVWIGSSTGLSHCRGQASFQRAPPPRSYIRSLFASGLPVALGRTAPIILPRSGNTLEVQVTALSFLNEVKVEHQVQLVGLEKTWQKLGGHVARYPALAPGRYRFKVRSRRKGEAWGPEAALTVEIQPNWWERSWLRTALWMPLLVRLGEGILRKLNEELETKVEEATAELRSKTETLNLMNGRLVQINEDMNRMLGIVAHDLRNPLNSIGLYAELLEDATDPLQLRKISSNIKAVAEHMNEMIRRLLDTSQIEAGKLELRLVPVQPAALAERVLDSYRAKAEAKGIDLHLDASGDLPPILADPFYLKTILDNLVSNAVKFTAPGPPPTRVQVRLRPGRIEVSDQGPGFTEADKAKVFGRFTRLSARPTAGESSTGLGLHIVRTIVEAMGGDLELESLAGQGATFMIEFPLA